MQLLVLGGTVFLGRHLSGQALERGHEPTLFTRGQTNPGLFPDAEHVHGDRDGGLEPLRGRTFDAVIDTSGFRFGKLLDYRDPQFLPGGAKYLDVPGFLALGAPHPLWLSGEGADPPLVADTYRRAGHKDRLTVFTGEPSQKTAAAVAWLIK